MAWAWWIGGGIAGVAALGIGAYVASTAFVETPDYRVIASEGAFELRDYPSLRVAETARPGDRGDAASSAFRALAGYIFARDREGPSIAMTAPVTQTAGATQDWVVGFIMPSEYGLADLPSPARGDIALREIPARQVAAVRFSGRWRNSVFEARAGELVDWMANQGLRPQGQPIYAYYNDPFTPGFLRRNEVLFAVSPTSGG